MLDKNWQTCYHIKRKYRGVIYFENISVSNGINQKTPIMKLNRFAEGLDAEIFAKS